MNNLISKDNFANLVKLNLKNKSPFAFARYSDGEIMLLNRKEYQGEYDWAIKKLIGYNHTEEENVELSNYLVETLKKVDIIGFPTPRHLNRADFFSKGIEVFEKYVSGDLLDKRLLASIDVFYDWLGDAKLAESQALYPDYFEDILRDQEVVNIVSCRDLGEQLKKKYNIGKVNSYIIAPEAKFTSGYEGERHYPYQFKKIEEWIKSMDCTGQVCLVAGGVISKIYNIWFKEQGGISLDIGAVADLFAGKCTRGKKRGLDIEDDTFKL